MKKHVYDVYQVTNNYDLFLTMTQAIGDYVATHYGNDIYFITSLVELELPELMEPALPDAGNALEVEI